MVLVAGNRHLLSVQQFTRLQLWWAVRNYWHQCSHQDAKPQGVSRHGRSFQITWPLGVGPQKASVDVTRMTKTIDQRDTYRPLARWLKQRYRRVHRASLKAQRSIFDHVLADKDSYQCSDSSKAEQASVVPPTVLDLVRSPRPI